MNSFSQNRQLIAKCALAAAKRGNFETLESCLQSLTNPHDYMNTIADTCAREGDFEFLILQLRIAEASPEVMALAADIIEGKVKRAKGKPKNSERTFAQNLDAALRVRELERQKKCQRKFAVSVVAEEFGMSTTAVQNALAAFDEPSLVKWEEFHKHLADDAPRIRAWIRRGGKTTSKKVPT